jgi:hypothetical protein
MFSSQRPGSGSELAVRMVGWLRIFRGGELELVAKRGGGSIQRPWLDVLISILSHERKIPGLYVQYSSLRRIVRNADELSAAFAGHSLDHPLVRLAKPDYARFPGTVILQLGIRKWVSMPEKLPALANCRYMPSVTLNVKNDAGIGVPIRLRTRKWLLKLANVCREFVRFTGESGKNTQAECQKQGLHHIYMTHDTKGFIVRMTTSDQAQRSG